MLHGRGEQARPLLLQSDNIYGVQVRGSASLKTGETVIKEETQCHARFLLAGRQQDLGGIVAWKSREAHAPCLLPADAGQVGGRVAAPGVLLWGSRRFWGCSPQSPTAAPVPACLGGRRKGLECKVAFGYT